MAAKIVNFDKPFTVFSMEADKDYLLARLIANLRSTFGSRAGFFGQQACEKLMKALSVQNSQSYLETHSLLDLSRHCSAWDAYFKHADTEEVLEKFDLFDQVGRYGAAANFDPLSKGKSVGGTKMATGSGVTIAGAWVWTNSHLAELDSFVFRVRTMLDFSKTPGLDFLKAIVEENKGSLIYSGWKGPQSLEDVLRLGNAHFKS